MVQHRIYQYEICDKYSRCTANKLTFRCVYSTEVSRGTTYESLEIGQLWAIDEAVVTSYKQ